ncbi:hypothetical protein GCM10027592_03350 [Spirosoma flavus]
MQQKRVFYMVVCDEGEPHPSDLVDVRLADEQGRKRITYADFLDNPAMYGGFCITVDKYP